MLENEGLNSIVIMLPETEYVNPGPLPLPVVGTLPCKSFISEMLDANVTGFELVNVTEVSATTSNGAAVKSSANNVCSSFSSAG